MIWLVTLKSESCLGRELICCHGHVVEDVSLMMTGNSVSGVVLRNCNVHILIQGGAGIGESGAGVVQARIGVLIERHGGLVTLDWPPVAAKTNIEGQWSNS